jgi:hypothetical protein
MIVKLLVGIQNWVAWRVLIYRDWRKQNPVRKYDSFVATCSDCKTFGANGQNTLVTNTIAKH